MNINHCPLCSRPVPGYIPTATMDNIQAYAERHIDPGDFLIAVLSNDLREAFGRADDVNAHCMFEIVRYCYNHIDSRIWGSRDRVIEWLSKG